MKNIVLIGFMASGKTTIGKLLAKKLSCNFYDSDELIEEKEGMTVGEIFEKFGETEFRRLENELSKELANFENCVIALGGGFVLNPENIENLRKNSIIVYLKTNEEIIRNRFSYSSQTRPLMKNSQIDEVIARFKEREKFYKNYDICINLSINNSAKAHADEVLRKIKDYRQSLKYERK